MKSANKLLSLVLLLLHFCFGIRAVICLHIIGNVDLIAAELITSKLIASKLNLVGDMDYVENIHNKYRFHYLIIL